MDAPGFRNIRACDFDAVIIMASALQYRKMRDCDQRELNVGYVSLRVRSTRGLRLVPVFDCSFFKKENPQWICN